MFLEKLLPTDLKNYQAGDVAYSVMCDDKGMAIDDLTLLFRENDYLMVVNASNRDKVLKWMDEKKSGADVTIDDQTFETAMIAIQGPEAISICSSILGYDFNSLHYFQFLEMAWEGTSIIAARTGYTGEDGLELIVPNSLAGKFWDELILKNVTPIGLGARDTLRLECCYPLYGHELSPELNPLEARLRFCVNSETDYFGKQNHDAVRESGVEKRLIAFKLEGRKIAREGTPIFQGETEVGYVSSGSFCPSLGCGAGMGFVKTELSKAGTENLLAKIRNKFEPIEVVKIPLVSKKVSLKKS